MRLTIISSASFVPVSVWRYVSRPKTRQKQRSAEQNQLFAAM